MKKALSILIVLVLVLVGGIYLFQSVTGITLIPGDQVAIEDVLPEKPILYLELKNTQENINRLVQTPFWRALGEVDWDLVLSQGQSSAQVKMVVQAIAQSAQDPQQAAVLAKFLGQDIAAALYPVDIDFKALGQGDPRVMQDALDRLAESAYVVTRLDAQAQVAELITRSQDQLGDNVQAEDIVYKDQPIKVMTFQDGQLTVAYTRIKDLLIVAVDKFAIQRSIDAHQDDIPAFSEDANYIVTKKTYLSDSDIKFYANTRDSVQMAFQGLSEVYRAQGMDEEVMREQLETSFAPMKGFTSLGYSSQWGNILQSKIDAHFDINEMQDRMAKYYRDCQNTVNDSLTLIPEESVIYQWGHCFDMAYYWEEMKAEFERTAVPGQPSATQQISQYEQMIGMTVEEDLLPAFGREIGGYLKAVHFEGKFPIPEFAFFLRIADKNKAQKILGLLKNQPMAIFQSEDYQGVGLTYLALPIASHISPGYAFIGDYLMISANKEMLKTSIDVSQDRATGIAENTGYQMLSSEDSAKGVGLMYLEMDELAFMVGSLLEWSNEWISNRDRKAEAFQEGAQLRLNRVQEKIEEDEAALSQTQAEIDKLQARMTDMEDSGMLENSLKNLQEKEAEIRADIEASIEEAIEIQQTVQGYEQRAMPLEKREKYLNRVIYPVVDSFKTIEGTKIMTTLSDTVVESHIYTKF